MNGVCRLVDPDKPLPVTKFYPSRERWALERDGYMGLLRAYVYTGQVALGVKAMARWIEYDCAIYAYAQAMAIERERLNTPT